ncbi:hypothetical protein CUN67_30390 (plasmid) [Pantoea cypripedii]|uniref:Uncharacterized protein n=1 Tax=Pantoea cypripedii TaxID=55209 RepID=A0A6B9GCQ6_PANCY|nr:hypothetical protein [Pantoea cypripedii]QGY33220.1 hypothetical protein CUN67_30390 [Pantoea cypripedii]
MPRDITLYQAAKKAQQAEIICLMIECYPNKMSDDELSSLAALLRELAGNAAAWLIEEQNIRDMC